MKNKILILSLILFNSINAQTPLEIKVLNKINQYRDSLGLSQAEYDSSLSRSAEHHNIYQVKTKSISHVENVDVREFKEILTVKERIEFFAPGLVRMGEKDSISFSEISQKASSFFDPRMKIKVGGNLSEPERKVMIDNYFKAGNCIEEKIFLMFKSSKEHDKQMKMNAKKIKVGISIIEVKEEGSPIINYYVNINFVGR